MDVTDGDLIREVLGIAVVFALLAFVACAPGASAQAYPAKPIRFVVGFSPGGASDITSRIIGQKLVPGLPAVVPTRQYRCRRP